MFRTASRWHMILALAAMIAVSALVNAQTYQPMPSTGYASSYGGAVNANSLSDASDPTRMYSEPELRTYENTTYGFSISYPSDWTGREADPNDMNLVAGFLAPGEDMNNPANYITVQIEKLPARPVVTLDQYAQTVLSNLKNSYPDFKVVSSKDRDVSGSPGKELVYTMSSGQLSYQILMAMTIKGNKAYVMTFYSLADRYYQLEESARQIIGSFRFAGDQIASPAFGKLIGVPVASPGQAQ